MQKIIEAGCAGRSISIPGGLSSSSRYTMASGSLTRCCIVAVKLAVKLRAFGSQAASPSTSSVWSAGAHGWKLCARHVDHQVRVSALLLYGHCPSGHTSARAFKVLPSRSLKEVTQLIGSLLGGQVRLFTTRCCQQELKALGADFSGTTYSFLHDY